MAIVNTIRRCLMLPRRFRLRTLLLLISVIALLCGWEVDRLHRRANAIALLNRWDLCVNGDQYFDHFPWTMLPDSAFSWNLPWTYRCTSVSYAPDWPDDTPEGRAVFDRKLNHPMSGGATPRERKQLVAAIAALTELEYVAVPFELDDDDLRSLSGLANVGIFMFKTKKLTATGVQSMRGLRSLAGLLIDFDSPDCIPVDSISRLRELSSLDVVSLAHLPDTTAARIKAALPGIKVDICSPDE